MARISTYGNTSPVVAQDKWIGSDSQDNMATKNFTAQAVADFINKTGRSGRRSSGRDTFFRSRQRDPDPKDNSLVRKETYT